MRRCKHCGEVVVGVNVTPSNGTTRHVLYHLESTQKPCAGDQTVAEVEEQ